MKTRTTSRDKVNVITLGCSKNLVDSENFITQLKDQDWEVTHEDEKDDANIIVINTCGFIDRAKEESVDTILEYSRRKEEGLIDKLYVTGCLSQRYKDDLAREIPEVDAWFGTFDLPALLNRFDVDYKHELIGERISTTAPHFSYIKISEGCNRTCSFCAIPLMRGKHKSRSMDSLVQEAKILASRGVKELILIAQELTYYGLDIYKERKLPALLHRLADIDGIEWIRLHYAYPSKFPLDVVRVMAEREEVCNYLDIPLQHASDRMLQLMRRQISRKETEQLLDSIRTIVPDITLRTTMMVGHPGESQQDFMELMKFVEAQSFDRLGVFQYSHEENTLAHKLEDVIKADVKADRAARLMELQKGISLRKNEALIGKKLKTIIDRKEGAYFVGRSEGDSPEVDNEILIHAHEQFARIGDFSNVLITDALEYDLYGQINE